jgi:hypothetical protein
VQLDPAMSLGLNLDDFLGVSDMMHHAFVLVMYDDTAFHQDWQDILDAQGGLRSCSVAT